MAQQVYAVASLDVTEKSELRAENEQIHLERLCEETARQLSALNSRSLISKVFKSAVNISERNPASLIFITNCSRKQAIELLCGTGKERKAKPVG